MIGIREYIIAALIVACALLVWAWQSEVRAHSRYRGEVQAIQKAAEARAAEVIKRQEEIVKDVSNSWNSALPGVRTAAVAEYIRRFGSAARLCPGPADRLLPAVHPGSDVPGDAQGAEVHGGGEPEQLACSSEFISACGEDALARKLTREWALRNNLKVGD